MGLGNLVHALRFMGGIGVAPVAARHREHVDVETATGVPTQIPVDIYEPSTKSIEGVIMAVHGMSPFGERDPRLVELAHALTERGYRIIAPHIRDIAQLKISPDSPALIASLTTAVCSVPDWCPSGTVGMISFSFSGSLCIIASQEPCARTCISGLCVIGTYSNLDGVIPELMTGKLADPFGPAVMCYNFIERVAGPNPNVVKAQYLACLDAFVAWLPKDWDAVLPEVISQVCNLHPDIYSEEMFDGKQFGQFVDTLPLRDQQLARSIGCSAPSMPSGTPEEIQGRASVWDMVQRDCADELHSFYCRLSPLSKMAQTRVAIAIIHGIDDEVIPSTQSVELAAAMKAHNKRHSFCLTPLIGHADHGSVLSNLGETLSLAQTFSFFFEEVSTTAYDLRLGRIPSNDCSCGCFG